jgi:hypothetical protein
MERPLALADVALRDRPKCAPLNLRAVPHHSRRSLTGHAIIERTNNAEQVEP